MINIFLEIVKKGFPGGEVADLRGLKEFLVVLGRLAQFIDACFLGGHGVDGEGSEFFLILDDEIFFL